MLYIRFISLKNILIESFYQWIVFTYDLKKDYGIILFKQWPRAKWSFDLNHKTLLRESMFYSDYEIIVCNAAMRLL